MKKLPNGNVQLINGMICTQSEMAAMYAIIHASSEWFSRVMVRHNNKQTVVLHNATPLLNAIRSIWSGISREIVNETWQTNITDDETGRILRSRTIPDKTYERRFIAVRNMQEALTNRDKKNKQR